MVRALKNEEQLKLLATNYIGNLSYIYKNRPYSAPITYYFNKETHTIIGYSAEGQKTKAMRKNNHVCLSVSDIDSVNSWESILAHGIYDELTGSDAKSLLHEFSLGVKDLVHKKEHRELNFIHEFSSKIYKDDLPIVFSIKIEEITGKMRRNKH